MHVKSVGLGAYSQHATTVTLKTKEKMENFIYTVLRIVCAPIIVLIALVRQTDALKPSTYHKSWGKLSFRKRCKYYYYAVITDVKGRI